MALTNEDLRRLGEIVDESIEKKVGKIVDESIEKKVGKIVDDKIFQALDQMVLPELMKLEKKMVTKDDLRAELAGLENRLSKRIDNLGVIVTETRTNHERRIRRLEDEVGVEPDARLII